MAEYVWIGGHGDDLRCKTKSLEEPVSSPSELPEWNFDGSSTGQAPGEDSEVIIKPRAIFADPFRGGDNILVLCDCYTPQGEPIPSNTRAPAAKIFSDPTVLEQKPWYGMEQEYTLFKADGRTPLGWPSSGFPAPQGMYYCGIGTSFSFGRNVVEAHYKACLYAGVKISGINAEVMPAQWEYQVGPSEGISAGDHMWISRYLMHRVCEEFGVICSFEPKPIPGDWNGAGCHFNFSTELMRNEGGFKNGILPALKKLEEFHHEHIRVYGEGNEKRLTGKHETASMDKFSWGVANRGASVRVGRVTEREGKGYLEDRRPASNCDPYVVSGKIAETCIIRTLGK
eukprot:NODE_1006_length_1622_cov_3743.706929_g831_i0.p2 GENE.NODE_1006_length_1622_cov_3743.706929_g831_i0~~NODE_1006_length_1622_cov_3743.706929_g831_i0.p2  ORF type:complete len:385 (+),score=114.86 NODE_1006_length_1622_cov_3743.706929_g831_i0:135-1157(+)